MQYLVDELADYATQLKFEDLSDKAVESRKQVVLDAYGNVIYGRYCKDIS